MKRYLSVVFFAVLSLAVFSQRSVDKIFEQYSENDGYVTVTLKGNLLDILDCDEGKKSDRQRPLDITEIRILTQEGGSNDALNFIKMTARDLDRKDYEEYLSVRKADQDVRMLIRQEGRLISELLLVGGGEDNFIIQVKGKFTPREAEKISRDIREDNDTVNGNEILSHLD